MEGTESEGKTVAEAVESALKKLGLRRDQVEVQIVQEASSGFMGFGTKPARVRITQKHWGSGPAPAAQPRPRPRSSAVSAERKAEPQTRQRSSHAQAAPARKAAETPRPQETRPAAQPAHSLVDPQAACAEAGARLKEILGLMSVAQATVAASWDQAQERVKAVVETPEAERLIGKEGKTLEALQFLLTLILSRRLNTPVAAQVETLGYWEKREREILAQAQRGIEEVKSTGKSFRMPPMDAAMRRLVHRNLAGNPDIVTSSEGEGLWRKIVLRPRRD